jgi:hypothetical protein
MFEGETVDISLLDYIKAHNITFSCDPFTPVNDTTEELMNESGIEPPKI